MNQPPDERNGVWSTPQWFFDRIAAEFPMTTDVCADASNAKCARYFDEQMDGLKQEWTGFCWMNPPYGRQIGRWVKKAYESAMTGNATMICLLPARTDTDWWQDRCPCGEIRFYRGRLNFSGMPGGGKFPSALVVFHAHLDPGGIVKWDSVRRNGK